MIGGAARNHVGFGHPGLEFFSQSTGFAACRCHERDAVLAYDEDLAFAHDAGYCDFVAAAGEGILQSLADAGWYRDPATQLTAGNATVNRNHVVDLGCGSGVWAAKLLSHGFEVTGVDLSPDMVALARESAPEATLICSASENAALPRACCITALGEAFNYMDDAGNRQDVDKIFKHCYEALTPGGLLIFDVATPGRCGGGTRQTHRHGEDWAVISDAVEDVTSATLERHIITFRRVGDSYRRSDETHRLVLYDVDSIRKQLQSLGLEVNVANHYVKRFPFPPGLTAFFARKPA